MELILDVKILIASYDEDVWIKLVLLDEKFKQYAYKIQGIKQFVNLFTKIIYNQTTLFGKPHSIYDQPVEINKEQKEYIVWYYNGLMHRENDLPAVVYKSGTQYWYYNNSIHRENDLPAVIFANGDKYWYYKGHVHRENDLPAEIYNSGIKKWYYHGQLHRENNLPATIYADGSKHWYIY